MGAFFGRNATFGPVSAGITLTGLRTKSLSILGEPVDISDDDSEGWQQFLTEAARKGVSLSAEGLTKDSALLAAVGTGGGVAALENYELIFPELLISWTGDWLVSAMEVGLEHEGVSTFSCTIQSNGTMVFDDNTTD